MHQQQQQQLQQQQQAALEEQHRNQQQYQVGVPTTAAPVVAEPQEAEIVSVSQSGVVWTEADMRRQFIRSPPPAAQSEARSPDRAAGSDENERDRSPRRGKSAAELSNDEVLNRPSKASKQSEAKAMEV